VTAMSLIKTVDRFLYRAVTRDLRDDHVERYIQHLAVDHDETSVPNVIGRGFQIIDSKASAAPVVANDYFEQGVIVVEIMFYLLVALGCLRCLSMFQDDLERPAKEAARDELILRHKIFRLCNRAAILLTVLVLLSLPVLFLYVPGRGSGS
jgi:hypothetical protein